MKKNKLLICVVAVIIVAIVVVFCVNKFKSDSNEEVVASLSNHEIANLKEVDTELPEFSILINGIYINNITDKKLKDFGTKIYEFDAAVDNGWEVVTNHYVGVKLNDVLKEYDDMPEYKRIGFASPGSHFVDYKKEEVTDKTFLVFYRDGKPIVEGEAVNLLSVDKEYRYSVENLAMITLNDEEEYHYQNIEDYFTEEDSRETSDTPDVTDVQEN